MTFKNYEDFKNYASSWYADAIAKDEDALRNWFNAHRHDSIEFCDPEDSCYCNSPLSVFNFGEMCECSSTYEPVHGWDTIWHYKGHCIEYVEHKHLWRLYKENKPQDTIAYEETIADAKAGIDFWEGYRKENVERWNVTITVSGDVQYEEELTVEQIEELIEKAKEIKRCA